jgi:hypothetical protein
MSLLSLAFFSVLKLLLFCAKATIKPAAEFFHPIIVSVLSGTLYDGK